MSLAPALSYKNHFRFGYDGNDYDFRTNENQQWTVRYGHCERTPLRFDLECFETAKTIRQTTTDQLWVLFSGGVDSEVTLRSFVTQKIPINVAIMRFKNDLNIHDISYAVIACESLQIPYKFFDLDIHKFWENEALNYATKTQCISPLLLPTMWLVDQLDGYPVFGSGECLLVKRVPPNYVPGISVYPDSKWDLYEKEKIAAWYRHFIVRQRPGCPGFFQFTPEIMSSYFQDSFVQNLVNNNIQGKLSTESSKLPIYQQHFPLISRKKYTGYEKLHEAQMELRSELEKRFPNHNQIVKTEFFELQSHFLSKLHINSDYAKPVDAI